MRCCADYSSNSEEGEHEKYDLSTAKSIREGSEDRLKNGGSEQETRPCPISFDSRRIDGLCDYLDLNKLVFSHQTVLKDLLGERWKAL